MTPAEKDLLVRVARRLEEQADAAWSTAANAAADTEALDTAKRRRDLELADVMALRAYVKRIESEQAAKVPT